MKVLVTGSNGFIGRHVVKALAKDGHNVIGFDLAQGQDFTTDPLPTVDAICHVGAIGDVYACAENPAEAFRVNAFGTAHVAREAQKMGARLVYASTWEVYDWTPQTSHRLSEHDHCVPKHSYNASKYAGELAINAIHPDNSVCLRLGTAYGAGMRPNSVFSIFADKARAGKALTVQGTGEQGREFIHVHDVANAFAIAVAPPTLSRPGVCALNLTGDEFVSIKRLAELVSERYDVPVKFGEPRPGDVASALVANSLAKRVLDWQPEVKFEDGLKALLDEYDAESAA